MQKQLFILGAGGHGTVIADAAEKMNSWERIFFLDDDHLGQNILGYRVIDSVKNVKNYKSKQNYFIVAIGNNLTRKKIQSELEKNQYNIATIIHPFSSIGKDSSIGKGSVLLAGSIVSPSVSIGNGCILNTSCSVDHNSVVGGYVHLSPGTRLAGNVIIGENTWLGANATVINNIQIEKDSIIGANSLVINDILEKGTYVGSPIRRVMKKI